MGRLQGPWVKKLICRFMSLDAVPEGGGFSDGIQFLSDPKRIVESARNSTAQAFNAIDAVRAAPDCQWTTDEEIAEQIVTACDNRAKQRSAP